MKKEFKIIIGGLPGAGSSTVSRILSKTLKCVHIGAGDILKKMAKEKGMTQPRFDKWVRNYPNIDRELDQNMYEKLKENKKIVLTSKIPSYFINKGIDVLTVWLDANQSVRARRVAKREKMTYKEAIEYIKSRDNNSIQRYKDVYGIDLSDLTVYNLVIQSDNKRPKQIVDIIIKYLNQYE